MKRFILKALMLTTLSSFLTSCWAVDDGGLEFPKGEVLGYKPIYVQDFDKSVELQGPRSFVNPGKIYVKNELLLMNEPLEGVHVIDNSDPSNPVNIAFLKVKGSTDMALRNSVLYINQFNDILGIDVTDLDNPKLISREEGILNPSSFNEVPPEAGFYFECADHSKGFIIGWEKTTINSPKCYR